ncbi:lipopolysaccharide biosynthesis protein [Vibrio vulnificus]|uniref:lipopolysaccharide biosynthesis protein n=1 Tax=Vibrio vulnificus TaxID=672 RepID=UPI000929B414|nr:oligosaccharide flippase family protein [Vibrio vulnificus]EJE8693656.1 oligosaccharide flippase family protein [Vibrio vulnificus]OJI49973.1 Polysaccharide biosynthesis protein [Vibrio vulnificus]POB21971.1 hypothetical protein CRN22_18770 [Vibrio vulnificus]HAS8133311.1 hypothetical protein [Vibrio vulnificus]
MKQSVVILIVQLFNALASFFVTIYIASSVSAHDYSLFAVYQIVITFIAAFSVLGHETYISRNALRWKEIGCNNKIRVNISKAVISRVVSWLVLLLPALWYVDYFLSEKYSQSNNGVGYFFVLAGLGTSLLQSSSLILKGLNRYIESISINVIGMLLVKLISLLVFKKYGFDYYLICMIFGVVIVSLYSLSRIKEYISLKNLKIKGLMRFKKRSDFIFSAYCQYLTSYFDRLLLSFFVTPELLGTYNLIKQIQEMAKLFIEGFFDPLTQRLVVFKNENELLKVKLAELFKIQIVICVLAFVFVMFFVVNQSIIFGFLNVSKYPNFLEYITYACLASFLSICYKVKLNSNALLLKSNILFKYNLVTLFVSILVLVIFVGFIPLNHLYGNRLVLEVIFSFVNLFLFRKFLH